MTNFDLIKPCDNVLDAYLDMKIVNTSGKRLDQYLRRQCRRFFGPKNFGGNYAKTKK